LIVALPGTDEERTDLDQAMVASKSDSDVLTYDQAVRDVDVQGWREAMHKEIMSVIAQGAWEVVPHDTAATLGGKIIPGTWVLHCKRKPDGTTSKLKAGCCVRGDLQEAQDDTFAPVVRWEIIRMLLYFTLFFGLKTKSIDFSNAFVQAALKDNIFVHLLRGFHHDVNGDVCLKLKKSLYGISLAPRLWFEHLRDKLLARGFRQSKFDPCLFYSATVYLVVYIDDVILASRNEADIDKLVKSLKVDIQLMDDGELLSII
jgi:Reverse transcriptase (RNA-dependent DNA polymerase)